MGSGFMYLPEHFFVVVVVIFPRSLILSPPKKYRKLLFRDCYQANLLEVFYITFYQMSDNENLLWPMDYTFLNICSCVCVMRAS